VPISSFFQEVEQCFSVFFHSPILTGKFINLLPYGDEIILSRRTRKNLDTNQQDKIMDALSDTEVGLIARHNLTPENLEIAQAELKKLNDQWKEIELNAKELNEEGLVFQNTYFDQNFVSTSLWISLNILFIFKFEL